MATTYLDQFYVMDPGNPPASGTALTPAKFAIVDSNDDNLLTSNGIDSIDGSLVNNVWVGDTINLRYPDGSTQQVTGVTFYLADGRAVFTPSDGTVLESATFLSSTWVSQATQVPVGTLGPPCFLPGTMIATPDGERRVESLSAGDLVITKDAGAQPILWAGNQTVLGCGISAPVHFTTGTIGNNRPLRVSQQHRVLLSGWKAELYCGTPEILVPARHLVNGTSIRLVPDAEVTFHHLMLKRHHILLSDGAETESFLPGSSILDVNPRLAAQIAAACRRAGLESNYSTWQTARKVARPAEIRCLAA